MNFTAKIAVFQKVDQKKTFKVSISNNRIFIIYLLLKVFIKKKKKKLVLH